MYEEDGTGISRLKRIQDAAIRAMQETQTRRHHGHRRPSPTTPVWCCRPPRLPKRSKIEDIIRKIDMFDVDPGGTAMNDGMQLAMDEVEKLAGAGKLSQVLVLTDGETSGEQDCRELAERAAQKKIHLTIMGVGTEWKADLHQGPGQAGRGQMVLHRRQRQPGSRAHLRRGVRDPGRHRLHQRRDAPSRR